MSTVLATIVAILRAIVAGFAFKQSQDTKSAAQHEREAFQRFDSNSNAINAAMRVRDSGSASTEPSGPATPAPAVPGRESGSTGVDAGRA